MLLGLLLKAIPDQCWCLNGNIRKGVKQVLSARVSPIVKTYSERKYNNKNKYPMIIIILAVLALNSSE